MAGIKRRTIFVDLTGDKVRFHDWARVDTAIGTMAEPRCLLAQRPLDGVAATASLMDSTDDVARLDAMEQAPMGREMRVLAEMSEPLALHGGALWQRTGY